MLVETRAGLVLKAVVAALVGSVAGGTVGVWSLRSPAASAKAAAPVPAASPAATRLATMPATDSHSGSSSIPAATAAPSSANGDARVLERARTLARRPDVPALMALREDVARRAAERGDESSVKGELNELDLRLNEARTLQLKLDAEAFRKADSKTAR